MRKRRRMKGERGREAEQRIEDENEGERGREAEKRKKADRG